MKKALLLALAVLLSAVAPALAALPANVNFSGERGLAFGLVLDGRPLTRGVAREVHVDRLVPGLHWADVTIPGPRGRAQRFRSRVWLEAGLETSFMVVARPGYAPQLRQIGAVALYGPIRGPRGNGYQGNSYPSGGAGYNNGGYSNNGGGQYGNAGGNGSYDGGQYGNDGGSGNNGGAGYYSGSTVSSYRAMAPQDVDALVQAVKQRPFEATKLSMAKEALSQSSISADELKRLLRSLDFEASRVELAKYAHSHVADPQNFYRVYESFDFDASVQEVQQAVGAGQ